MKNHFRLIISVCSICFLFSILNFQKTYAGIGDTTIVQTFRFDSTMRAGVFQFPDDSAKTYQKIIMLYSMRCHNGLVSTGSNTNLGCGEWDYNCFTYVVDSSQTDSLRMVTGSYKIDKFTDSVFNYTTIPVYYYIQDTQKVVVYTSIISEDSAVIGSGSNSLNQPFQTATKVSRSQYLFTAAELTAGSLTAGDITGLRLDLLNPGSTVNLLHIRIKQTAAMILDENNPETSGFTDVYFLHTTFSSAGMQRFNFQTPFTWDGISNLIVDFSFTNAPGGTNNDVAGYDAGFNAAMHTTQDDSYLFSDGSLTYIDINPSFFPSITDQVTVAFWARGDLSNMPANTSIIEGKDANNRRQINIHLPWSDSNIYWDCGNDGSGYDRISKAATMSEIAGQWNFWAFTKNATTGTMNIYLNGALWATGTGKTKMIDIKSMVAGMGIASTNRYFGDYDEFSFWNKELSLASIQQIMNKDITNSHPDYTNLVAYYKLHEGSGNSVSDSSANGFDASVINPAWRTYHGKSLYRNFTSSTYRPNITFIKGVYTTSVQNNIVTDSLLKSPRSVISYSVLDNNLVVIDTIYVWEAGYTYIFDTAGVKIDSIAIASQNTITVTLLTYFQKRPMRMELINFITPYGINLNMNGLIGKTWEFDVTDYAPVLKGARFLAMEDGNHQEDNDIKFVFYEGTPPRDVKSIAQIWPSGSWVSPSYNEIVTNKYFEPRDILLSSSAAQYKIRSAISGHGQEGEFIARNHTITLNNNVNYTRQVWKACANNPIYPQGGTWVYDRAGWCPGAVVDTKEFEITSNVIPGATINLDYSLPSVANPGDSRYRVNNQLVSYGPANFTLDAAVDYIKTPSQRTEFTRLNPVCNAPVISIRNTGSATLTSVDITYGRVGGIMSVYNWTGSLAYLEATEVTLSAPNWLGTNTNEFIAVVSNPNGGADQYAGNDTLFSTFDIPASYPAGLVFELKTNNFGYETAYTLKDAQGTVVISRSNLGNNITYRDTVNLNTDCYTLSLTDQGDDGLTWWANSAQGSGFFRIRNLANGAVLKAFNGDFGDNIYQQFSVNFSLPVIEPIVESIDNLLVYPNPTGDLFTATFSLPIHSTAKIKLLNVLGEVLLTETIVVSQTVERMTIDAGSIENGMYYVIVEAGGKSRMKKLVIAR